MITLFYFTGSAVAVLLLGFVFAEARDALQNRRRTRRA
jgi:hypothetical protein